jgi:hypothetical protein
VTRIKARIDGRVVMLTLDDDVFVNVFALTEQDCRRLRAEMNRCIQEFAERRAPRREDLPPTPPRVLPANLRRVP